MAPDVAALQAVLAGEHAAVYAYGVVGGRSGERDQPLAWTGYEQHRARRDRLTGLLDAGGHRPVAAEVAYALPFRVDDRRDVHRLAALIERRCAALYADVVTATDGDVRRFAARALADCATTAVRWGHPGEPFPGLSER